MPTNRIRRLPVRRQVPLQLTRDLLRELLYGDFFFAGFQSRELFALAWSHYGGTILPAWISTHPGTRPFGAWLFELVPRYGERRLPVPTEERERYVHRRWNILHMTMIPPALESETQYLRRHNLLTETEGDALGERDGGPYIYRYELFAFLADKLGVELRGHARHVRQ